MLRSVAEPAAVGRLRVRPGQRVVIATYNCTRVRGRGFAPERSQPDLGRLWFGAGPHFCIGYPLAAAQARALAGAVLRHAPLRVVRRRYARGVLIPGYRELAVARG
jgi:cytochrome P450